jgi:hypothetical protein
MLRLKYHVAEPCPAVLWAMWTPSQLRASERTATDQDITIHNFWNLKRHFLPLHSNKMAEQLLDQARDLVDGQIVRPSAP